MATIHSLKKKLRVILSTKKLTKAMKTASTIKFSKLYSRYSDYEKYEEQCNKMYKSYRKDFNSVFSVDNPDAPILYVLLSGNKGMCGGFNTELMAFFEKILRENEKKSVVLCCGKKGREYFENKKIPCDNFYELSDLPSYSDAYGLFCDIKEMMESGKISGVKIIYPEYHNVVMQKPVCENLFTFDEDTVTGEEPLFVPDRETVINSMAEKVLVSILYKKMLETALGAQAATLTTMRSAYDTACEYSAQLQTQINRKRQSQVTADVIENSSENSMEGDV